MAGVIASTLLVLVVRTPSGDAGLPKVRYRMMLRFRHLCSQCSTACGSSMHSEYVGSTFEFNKWAYALSSGVSPDQNRARKTAFAWLEVARRLDFQGEFSYAKACLEEER